MSEPADIRQGWRRRLEQCIGSGDVEGAADALQRVMGNRDPNEAPPPDKPAFEWLTTADIFAPLPPTPWAVEGLQLAPGRPGAFVGFGSSMKSLSAQSAALSMATGQAVWGEFAVPRPLNVRHIDMEQGKFATRKRYQRLAIGQGLDWDAIDGRLQLACHPRFSLADKNAEEVLAKVSADADVVLLDSLRALLPGVDENSSEVRVYIDRLTRVSEAEGVVFILIHHSPKPSKERTDKRAFMRGSGGIYDGCGSVFLISGSGQDDRTVDHIKPPAEAEGGEVETFGLRVEDVEDDGNPRAGVRVRYLPAEALEAVAKAKESPTDAFNKMKSEALAFVRDSGSARSRNAIAARLTGNRTKLLQAIRELLEDGELVEAGGAIRCA